MTISLVPADERIRRFDCTGGETLFPVTYPFFAAADLLVLRERAAATTTLTLDVDYAVAGAGEPSGGAVTLAAPAEAGDRIVIASAQPVARTAEWQDGAALTARALNAEFARWWIALQDQARDAARSLRLPVADGGLSLELPPATERANRMLGFDAAGEAVVIVPNAGNLALTPFGEAWIAAADAAAGRALLGAPAASEVTSLATDVAGRVLKAGDTLSGALLFPSGSAAAPSMTFAGDPDTGIWRAAADNLQVTVGGESVFRVAPSFVQTTKRLALPADAENALDAVPKQQLDAAVAASRRVVVLHDSALAASAGSMNFTIPDENALLRVIWINVSQTSVAAGLKLRWDLAFDAIPTWVAGPIQLEAATTGELWRGWWEIQNLLYGRKQSATANSWETGAGSQHAAVAVPNSTNRVRSVRLVALGATAIAAGARVIIVQERLA